MLPTNRVALIVTTEHRGVFFGYGVPDISQKTITLTDARMIVYWSQDMRGVTGLASVGPSKTCRVSHPVPVLYLAGVTALMECTPAAVKQMEAAPWKS